MTLHMQKVIIVLLILGAAFLSYRIYERYTPSEKGEEKILSQEQSTSINPEQKTAQGPGQQLNMREDLSPNEQLALQTPGPSASEEERANHFRLVQSIAKPAEFLDISDCKADPVVLKVKDQSKFTVRNTDNADRKFVLSQSKFIIIPALSDTELTADFGLGPGIYGFGCDNSFSPIGLLFVEP
jgi:hypothetical protein